MSDKIKSLYKALKADGADVGTEQEFTDWFQAPGEEGYKNRKYVYDTFKADGADIGNSYEEFRDWLGLKARKQPLVQPNQQYSQRVLDAHDSPTNVAPNYKDHAQIAKELGELNKPVAAESTRVAKPVAQPQRRNTNVIRQKQNPLPQGFGELSQNLIPSAIMSEYEQDARRAEDYGNNIEQIARTDDAIRTINGQGSPKGKERLRAMAQQLKDRADYAKATEGKELKDEVLDLTDIGITPTLARDEEGNPLVNEDGTPIVGIENSQVKANTQGYMQQQTYKDDLARNIQQNQEELAKLQEELKELKQNQAPKVLSPFDLSLDDGSGMFTADTDISAMSTAIRLKQETIERLQDALDRSNQSFWHGAGTEVWNENNFLFGIQGFADNVTLERVKMKVENGEQISLAERALLETSMESDRAKTIEQQTASDFYNYGKTAGKAVHLVKDFLLGGKIIKSLMGGGAALGVSVADAVGANGVSRILLKGLGIGMGDLAAGFGMTTTIQSAETASRIMEKNLGNVTQDEQGNFKFEGGKDALRATFEGIVENTIENATEAGGINEALGGVVSRALGKRGLGWVSRAVNNLTTNKFLRSARIQSLPEEILEEYEGQIAQGLLVDSEQLKELGDAKTHKDIILGTVFSMGVLQAPHLAHKAIEKGYNATQYYRYKRKVDKADKAAFDVLEDKWESLRSRIDGTTNDDMAALTQEIADSNQYTDLEKIYISRYIYNLTFMRGYNSAEMNNAKGIAKGEEDVTDDEEADDTEQLLASEDVGYNATEPEEKQRIKNQLQLRMQTSTEVLGEDVIKRLEDSPIPTLLELRERGEEAEINAALDYLNAQYAYNGMVDGAQDRIQAAQEQAEYVIKRRTNFTTLGEPTIIPVITQQDKRMYITDGEVSALEDGSIDLNNSNDDLIAVDEEGNVSFLSAKDIKTVEEQINPAQALEETRNNIAQEISKRGADEIDGVLPFLPNDVYQGADEQGTPLQITILQDNGDGSVFANVTGLGEGVAIPKQTIQSWVDGLRMANLQQEEAERLAQYEPAEEYDYEQGADIEGYEPVEDYSEEYGNVGNNGSGYEEYEQPFDGVTQAEAQAEAEQYQANRPAMEKIPVLQDEKGQPILNKKGRPQYLWTQAPVETTADALSDLNDGILVDARDTAQNMKKQADDKLQKVKAQKVKGDDPIEEAESRKEIRNQVQAAQAEVDYWKNVTQEINKRMSAESARIQAEIEAKKTQEQREAEEAERKRIAAELDAKEREAIRKEIEKDSKKRNEPYKPLVEAKKEMADDEEAMAILNDTEPRDLAEWVSSLIQPHSMLWQDEDGRGLQSELGLNRSDIQKFVSLLAQRDNGGKPFAEVVDEIYSELPDAMKSQYTDQDVRNTLLDLFNEGSVARMRNLAEEHRIEEARAQYDYNRRREEEAELQAWADAFHLSPEERESFEAWMEEDTPIELSDEELAHIINIIEQENEQSGGSQESGVEPDTRAEETGDNELPSEQPRAETSEQPEQGSEDNAVEGENEPDNVEPTATSGNGYTITPTKYTTKRGKELDVQLVTFANDLTKEQKRAADKFARDKKGWFDRAKNGYMMRSEADAEELAKLVGNDAAVQEAQPISLADIQGVTDEANGVFTNATIGTYEWEDEDKDWEIADILNSDGKVIGKIRRINENGEYRYQGEYKGKNDSFNTGNKYKSEKDVLDRLEQHRKEYKLEPNPTDVKPQEQTKPKVTLGFNTQGTGVNDKTNAIRIFQNELDNIINKKRGYADQFKKFDDYRKKYGWNKYADFDLYAVIDDNGNFIGFSDNPRGAYDIALNNDLESFMVVRQQPTDEGIEYNATYGWLFTNDIPDSEWRDDNGVLREEVKQKATFKIAGELPDVKMSQTMSSLVDKDWRKILERAVDQFSNLIADNKERNGKEFAEVIGNNSANNLYAKIVQKVIQEHVVSIKVRRDGKIMDLKVSNDKLQEQPEATTETAEQPQTEETTQEQPQATKPPKSKYVSDEDAERFAQLKERLRQKLLGQMNMGIDPEIFTLGVEMTYMIVKNQARKFADYAKAMIEEMGDAIRPYLKAFYNGARELPELEDVADELTPYEEVRVFDVTNFDKEGAKDLIKTAEVVAKEDEANNQAETAKETIKENVKNGEKPNKKGEKPLKPTKNNVSSQQTPSLFGDLFGEEETLNQDSNDRLRRNDEAVRTEGVRADNGQPTGGTAKEQGTGGKGTSQEADGTQQVRGGEGNEKDRTLQSGLQRLEEQPKKNVNNNHAERGKDYAPKGVDGRIEANIAAIELMKQLIESGKKATRSQMSVLRKFSGWGGLGKAFNESAYGWSADAAPQRLRKLLTDEEFEQAELSRSSAYYTPAKVIDSLWDIARALGFKGGNVLEGSAGIGNIIGAMPTDMSERSNIHAVEVDGTTGNILSLLYPDAKVDVQGFEQTKIPNGSVDLCITNVPFGDILVKDETGDKDLSKRFTKIHDFCIAKNIRKLREGGIGIFITTSGTLDNSQGLRDWIVGEGNADVVGAFRMHKDTFGGASVTSDIIVVRKRVNGKKSPNAIDVSQVTAERTATYTESKATSKGIKDVTRELSMDYNKYFIDHPEMMGGEMAFNFEKGETYRGASKMLFPAKGVNQEERLNAFVESLRNKDWESKEAPQAVDESQSVYEELGEDIKEGSMFIDGKGNLCIATYGRAVPLDVNANKVKGHAKQECFKAYSEIKDAVSEVLAYQIENTDDKQLKSLLDKLNKAFDDFTNTYGHFYKNPAISFLRNDMDYSSIAALETAREYNDKNGKRQIEYKKGDIFSKRVVEKDIEPKPKTTKDGVLSSIYKFGRIDLQWMASVLPDKTEQSIKDEIINDGLGFENPVSGEVEVNYEYLSGNVREKLRQAIDANDDGRFDTNIKALRKVVPMNIPSHLIEFTLGSSWLPAKLYEDYINEKTGISLKLLNTSGTWVTNMPKYGVSNEKNRQWSVESKVCDKIIWGHELMMAALQNKTITVQKTQKNYDGTTETISDKEATAACSTKIDEIRQDFKDWARDRMQNDTEISERVEEIYNERFNNYVPKSIPDMFVPEYFGGASRNIHLRPHQAKAAIRATTQPIMLAHEVGTGKTFTLITAAMEMRRLGTARKPMIVVQNATVGQFVESAKELYPNAKILTLEEADRSESGRKAFYAKIRYNDWDMVVIPQSTLDMIPDSEERQIAFVKDKIDEKLISLQEMQEADVSELEIKQAQSEIDKLEDELSELSRVAAEKRKKRDGKKEAVTKQNAKVKALEMLDRKVDDVENFDEMGIDAILVDEAHSYKHLGFATAMQRGVKGIDPSYSKKSQGLYLKCQSVKEKTGGKNVVFATGTPISNTAAEIWTFMRYLMPKHVMEDYGIYYFDDFVRNFGNLTQMLEFQASGRFKENNRFAGYVNLPELVRIWSGVTDTVLTNEASNLKEKIPDIEGGKAQDLYLPQTRSLRSVMKFVKDTLNEFENMTKKEKKQNSHIPLVMYGIAKAAAVDARLVLREAEDEPNSKTNEAVRQTLRSLKETESYKGTVAIFADVYQNKESGFNLYEDIKKKLIENGVPENQIVIMSSSMSVKKKLETFDKVNSGEVRVILGSTFTLGTGVNIQERLHTLIHLDAPVRPMDYTQRNGRILRQGNIHKEMGKPVRILRFGVEDSLDVTAYQRLKTKGAIADSIMHGNKLMNESMENRTMDEEEDVFGDTVAQLSGSQYALLKQQAEREVRKLEAKERQHKADQTYIHNKKPTLKGLIESSKKLIESNEKSLRLIEGRVKEGKPLPITIGQRKFNKVDAMDEYFKEYNKKTNEEVERMRKSYMDEQTKRELPINIGGFDFVVRLNLKKEFERSNGSVKTVVRRNMVYSCAELELKDIPVKSASLKNGINDIIENVLTGNDFRERIEAARDGISRNREQLALMEKREGKPFEFAKELEEARARYDEYEALMKKELEEKEAKYAEMDANIETASDISGSETSDELYRLDEEMRTTDTLPFYSNAARAVEQVKQDKATPEQWLKMIEKNGGLKSGEDKWIGLSDWLKASKAKSLTKQEVMDYIRSNQIQIEEDDYSPERSPIFKDAFGLTLEDYLLNGAKKGMSVEDVLKSLDRTYDTNMYGAYKDGIFTVQDGKVIQNSKDEHYNKINLTRLKYTTKGLENKREIALTVPTIESWNTQDEIHFGDAGQGRAVAWVRFGETTDAGGNRVLVIDEIQSKRHQEGREKGYAPIGAFEAKKEMEEAEKEYRKTYDKYYPEYLRLVQQYNQSRGEDKEAEKKMIELREKWQSAESRYKEATLRYNSFQVKRNEVPSAPFEKNWHELAMKRMLRYAAENGYDKVAWTTGEQQAERYDLGESVSSVDSSDWDDWSKVLDGNYPKCKEITIYDKFDNDKYRFTVDDKGIVVLDETGTFSDKKLSEIVGKEIATKLMNDGVQTVEGEDLRIGGEGMKGFYDEILPRFMNKYGKKWGAKVGTVELPNVEESAQTMWAVDVTPEMKDSVMQGQPMFRQTQQGNTQRTTMQAIRQAINDIIDKLHIADRVTVLESTEGLKGKKARAKGWFDVSTGKIVVVLPNNRNAADAMRTILHEAVAHMGLRKLFGKEFNNFLMDVYSNSTESVRRKINANAAKKGWDIREATEEYLASLAETQNFEQAKKQGIWNKVKEWFNNLLSKVGIPKLFTTSYDDNELRYILWRSWRNLTEGGNRDYIGMAEDVVKREDLGVGEFAREAEPIITPEQDAAYINAVERGDMETAKQMVMDAAKEAGYTIEAYHGTKSDFTTFDKAFDGSNLDYGTAGRGFYFTTRRDNAENIARNAQGNGEPKVISVFLKIQNPKEGVYAVELDGSKEAADRFTKRAKAKGYDGIHAEMGYGVGKLDWYIAFEPSQIKSADPVTYDDNGNIIPLSERFNDANEDIRFSLREEEPPTKTGIGYKVFVLKDGKLYPPMVANPNGEATPVGVWLNADAAPVVGETKTGRKQVKAGGKGTQGGSGKLAYRPGWHLGEIPYALQFNRVNPKTGQRELFPSNFVWAEVEYADDIDYNEEARSYGINANGNYQHSLAGLPRIPENGSYKYRTNPDTRTDDWIITGAMKVNRILKPSEVDKMVMEAGREPQPRQEGAVTDEQVEALNKSLMQEAEGNDIRFREDEENEIKFDSETTDIWNDRRLSMTERITAAATRLAANQQDNKTLRNDAVRAISNNLAELNKAMSLQRKFDMATAKRITDLARVLMDGGYLKDIRQQEVKRLLAAVKNSVGHNDIENDVQKIMDILVDNQLRNAEATLHELETIKGSKVNASGVEVIGQLDPDGAHIMKAFKKYRDFSKEDIADEIANAEERMTSSDNAVADEAALDYVALQFAQEYAQNIKDSKTDEKLLRDEIKQTHDDASERERLTDAYRETIKSLQDAIRQTKIERVQAYNELVARLTNSLRGSIENAKAFKEAEQRRISEIHHNANSDMEGRPSNEHYKPKFKDKFVNNSLVQFLFQPLMTFEQMLRVFGSKSANGEGYLYNRFMRGWVDARQKEIKGVRSKYATLDAKAREIFGKKVKDWGGLIRYVGKLPKAEVTFWDGGEMRVHELTQGNLMYIYMVNKMLDGRMKLRKMGISEENVAEIEEMLDPRLKSLADWLQEDFLVKTRNEYNKTHKRMFGASMAAIENYFPLKILSNARVDNPEDLDNPDFGDTISTTTGSIIKRRRNTLALDITGADALNVILDHVAQMEHWNAFAEFKRDLNTLRTYKRFRNQVYNMNTIYGSGKKLWNKFNDVCRMAAGVYRPPRATLDEAAVNFAKGVTAAKVSFRVFTALKQFLSFPAYLPEARFDILMKNLVNPAKAWKWGMENLPIFNERWKSRIAGDPRLMKTDMDWKMWRTQVLQLASRWGMKPNAFVDALTVSMGAHAIYETKKKRYLKEGYSNEQAERKAIQDAEIAYNLTQQSSESAFTSTMQVDRSWLSVLLTVFRNSPMSYQRQLHNALRNFKHNMNLANYDARIEYMKKQYIRDGLDEETAEDNAENKYTRQLLKDWVTVATFGYILQLAWNMGAYLPYLLFGGDDDEKDKMLDDVAAHTTFGSLEGLTGGDILSQAGGMLLNGEGNPAYLSKDMPLTSDISAMLKKVGNGESAEAINDIIQLAVQSGIGVNPQSITDGVLGIMDVCGDDPALAHEAMICVWRILQVPQSQIDKLYFDEVGLSGEEVSNYTPQQLAQRYAQFKVKRGRLLAPWAWNDREKERKLIDKANKTIKERVQHGGDGEISEAFERAKEIYDEVKPTMSKANKAMQKSYIDSARVISSVPDEKVVIYNLYKKADENLDKLAKGYLNSNTHAQAELYRKAILDYRAAMADAMNAPDKVKRERAIKNITAVMDDFKKKKKELNAEY